MNIKITLYFKVAMRIQKHTRQEANNSKRNIQTFILQTQSSKLQIC